MQYSNQHFFKAETLNGRFSIVRKAHASSSKENYGVRNTERMQQGQGKGEREKGACRKSDLGKKRG